MISTFFLATLNLGFLVSTSVGWSSSTITNSQIVTHSRAFCSLSFFIQLVLKQTCGFSYKALFDFFFFLVKCKSFVVCTTVLVAFGYYSLDIKASNLM